MLRGIVLGGSGASGRELIQQLAQSSKWKDITVIATRDLPEWEALVAKKKLRIYKVDSLDNISERTKWEFKGYSSVFNCLGPRKFFGEENFKKVVHTYALQGAKLAKVNSIPHYSLVSSMSFDKDSSIYYKKWKGQAEHDIRKESLPATSFFRPGLLIGRKNDFRISDILFRFFPPSIFPNWSVHVKDLAKAMRIDAQQVHNRATYKTEINEYSNKDIINLAQSQI